MDGGFLCMCIKLHMRDMYAHACKDLYSCVTADILSEENEEVALTLVRRVPTPVALRRISFDLRFSFDACSVLISQCAQ